MDLDRLIDRLKDIVLIAGLSFIIVLIAGFSATAVVLFFEIIMRLL